MVTAFVVKSIVPVNKMYCSLGRLLITRMNEREESVKADVFEAFAEALRQVNLSRGSSPDGGESQTSVDAEDAMEVDHEDEEDVASTSHEAVEAVRRHSVRLIKVLQKQLASKSSKNIPGALHVLQELVVIAPNYVCP